MAERLSKKEMWEKVRERLSVLLAEFKNKDRTALEDLAQHEFHENMQVGTVSFQIGAWSEKHEDGRLAVLVDAWRYRFLGWSQSAAVGFYVDTEGHITEMKEEDFWEHGY
jgi:hypothetical protein